MWGYSGIFETLQPGGEGAGGGGSSGGMERQSLQRLLGSPSVQLHWLEGLWGTLQVEQLGNSYFLEVGVSDAGEGFSLRGILTDIDAGGFGFKGSFSTQVSHIAGGMNCQRPVGDYRFVVYPGGDFWRLVQMDNPCGRATDYFDIFW